MVDGLLKVYSMKRIVGIILARGDSKGIPRKNVIPFCGKPLIEWTIKHLQEVKKLHSIWVSSENEEILSVAKNCGVKIIERPKNLSTDTSSSESGWLHALDKIEHSIGNVDIVVAPQVTSPLRHKQEISKALDKFCFENYDSLFSSAVFDDLTLWNLNSKEFKSVNFDYKNRQTRQQCDSKQYVENGSFYIFKSEILRHFGNRLGGKIGVYPLESWKIFEIDNIEDVKICEILMRKLILIGEKN